MFDRFTERARKVMTLARQEAQKLNHDYIGTGHILLGLAQEGSGVAAQVIKNLDMDVGRLRAELERLEEPGTSPVSGSQLPFSPRAKRVLEHALEEALNFGQDSVGTEHLLLGLIRECEGPAAHMFQNLDVRTESIREMVLNIVGVAPPGPEQEEARALVEAILLKRLHHEESVKSIPGGVELEVGSSHGPKGWGFQLWIGHRALEGDLRTEMAFWVARAPTLEEHFAAVLDVFVRLVRSETGPPEPPPAA